MILDILLIIGVAVNLLKGVDLFVSEAQQKIIQGKMESFTLYLDEINPINWLAKLKTKEWQYRIYMIGVIELLLVVVANLVMGEIRGLSAIGLSQVAAVILSLFSIPLITKRYGPQTIGWLVREGRSYRL